MNATTLGLICGAALAAIEMGSIWFARWSRPGGGVSVIVVSLTCRFLTGLLVPTVDIGLPLWATGLVLGILLAIPVAVVARTMTAPLGLGALGGIIIAGVAELAL